MLSLEPTTVLADEAALLEQLGVEVARFGTQKDAAASLGISAVYLSDVLNGRRPIHGMAGRLGYAPVTVYVPAAGPLVSTAVVAQIVEGVRQAMGKAGA